MKGDWGEAGVRLGKIENPTTRVPRGLQERAPTKPEPKALCTGGRKGAVLSCGWMGLQER